MPLTERNSAIRFSVDATLNTAVRRGANITLFPKSTRLQAEFYWYIREVSVRMLDPQRQVIRVVAQGIPTLRQAQGEDLYPLSNPARGILRREQERRAERA